MKNIFSIFLLLITFVCSGVIAEPVLVDIKEWTVPWEDSRPRDPYVDPKGRIWFCGQVGAYIAMLDPTTGEFKKYDMKDNERPHNLVIDEQGIIWYAGNTRGYIGRLDPNSGEIKKYPMLNDSVRDPHTLVFDSQGDLWFTAQQSNYIGKLFVKTGEFRFIKVPTPRARPYGIWIDFHDRPWVALFGSNKLAMVDPVTFLIKEYELPRESALPRRLAVTSDNKIWYVDYKGGYLGQFDPETNKFNEWLMPGAKDSRPYGMVVDDQDRLWFVETGISPNRFVGFEPATQKFFSVTDIPSGGGSVRHMYFHLPTHSVWFGADSNTIGRALIPK